MSSSSNNQGEPTFLLLVVVALLAVIGWLIWRTTGYLWLNYFFRWLRFAELWPLNLLTHHYGACLDWLKMAQAHDASLPNQNFAATPQMVDVTNACFGPVFLKSTAESSSYYYLSMPPVVALGNVAMHYYRWLLALPLAYVGIRQALFSPNNKFFSKHNLESLIATQAKMWPVISPIVKFNPSKTGRILGAVVPDKLPIFAEALSPEEWVSWHRIAVVNGIPDRDAARRAFIKQLGPRWKGAQTLPVHMRSLLATFALKGMQKRDESDDLLGRIALCWSPENGFQLPSEVISEIDKILADPEIGGKLTPITEQHAWRTTALLGALKWARSNGGVLAPAQFLWVRAEDRGLWYPLNNLGRRSFHSEGAGAMAHFMAEEAAKKPLPIPRVDTAIITLNTYLHDPDKRPVPIPPREESAKA